ncbi:MAG: zinc ribbon domain-containing protein [Treponema sp.]|jgi:putative FmdB family regulatory protein|nr:zinc ribbon domain-containing protein [Treponema sp.]
MPTYEYECKSCGHSFEAFQSMSDAPLRDCPQCGKEVRRLINGGTGVIFKGSGFYVTDKKAGASKDSKKSGDKKPDDKKPGGEKPDSACASCAAASACPSAPAGGAPSTGNAGAGSSAAKAAG